MARRRRIEIAAKELKCNKILINELMRHPKFADFDPDSVKIWAYERYEPVIADIDKAIRNFDHYMAANRDTIPQWYGEKLTNKAELAKMLGVSRPTLNKWIGDGVFEGCEIKALFRLSEVRLKLLVYRDKHQK